MGLVLATLALEERGDTVTLVNGIDLSAAAHRPLLISIAVGLGIVGVVLLLAVRTRFASRTPQVDNDRA